MIGNLIFLGTGGSMGVPVIGCSCSVCLSQSPYNQRSRPSALLQFAKKNIVIDAGPDFRTQALKNGIDHLEGVIFTHAHHDHTAGIDDLRVYTMRTRRPIPCLASVPTADDLKMRYGYIFEVGERADKLVSKIQLQIMEGERGKTVFADLPIRYMTYTQAGMPVNGLCIGNLSFVSDIRQYPESIYEDLQGTEILILSALRYHPSPMHFSIDEAVEFSRKVGAKMTWLTHIAHEVDHEEANTRLPSNIQLAYDGQSIKFQV
jgi:phosphoribosyl 1,2-cyclic phosphate phosphodiesterase